MSQFDAIDVQHIPRIQNAHADALARLAFATTTGIDDPITIEVIKKPRTPAEILNIHEEDWRKPILDFVTTGHIPDSVKSPHSFHLKASRYTVLKGNLYKCGFNVPLLHCVDPSTVREMLEEFHQGTCGTHEGPRTLASRILCYGYYWPHLHQDTKAYVSKCD